MMAAETLGGKLLREIESEKLSDVSSFPIAIYTFIQIYLSVGSLPSYGPYR
jgi:hypothetical protein